LSFVAEDGGPAFALAFAFAVASLVVIPEGDLLFAFAGWAILRALCEGWHVYLTQPLLPLLL
jgi:hypothetical protein